MHSEAFGRLKRFVWMFPQYSALIKGDWKIIIGSAAPTYDGWWTNGDYRWTHANKSDTDAATHLYNITDDPGEHVNLAEKEPELVAMLLKRLEYHADPANGFKKPQSNLPHPKGMPQLNPSLKGSLAPFM